MFSVANSTCRELLISMRASKSRSYRIQCNIEVNSLNNAQHAKSCAAQWGENHRMRLNANEYPNESRNRERAREKKNATENTIDLYYLKSNAFWEKIIRDYLLKLAAITNIWSACVCVFKCAAIVGSLFGVWWHSDINGQYIILYPCVVKLKYKSEDGDAIAAIKTFIRMQRARNSSTCVSAMCWRSSVAHDSRKLAHRSEQFDDIYGV